MKNVKKCTKTLLSTLLCMALLIAMLPNVAFAAAGDTVTTIDAELGTPKFAIDDSGKTAGTAIASAYSTIDAWYADNGNNAAHDVTANASKYNNEIEGDALSEVMLELMPKNPVTTAEYKATAWVNTKSATQISGTSTGIYVNYLDVKFKLPDVTNNVEAYLFSYSLNGIYAGSHRKVMGIKIHNGLIYTHASSTNGDADNANAKNDSTITYNETAINDGSPLLANTWYRAIRILDTNGTGEQKEKFVFLKEGTAGSGNFDTVVAESKEWTKCGSSNKGGANGILSMGFDATYPAGYTGRGVLIKDFKLYNEIEAGSANVSFSDMGRYLSYDASAADLKSAAPIGARVYNASTYQSKKGYVTFTLPSVNEGNVLNLFRENFTFGATRTNLKPNKSSGYEAVEGDSFAVSVEGSKVYAHIYNPSSSYIYLGRTIDDTKRADEDKGYYNTATKLVEVSPSVYYNKIDLGITLSADTKYTVLLERYDIRTEKSKNVVKVYEGEYTGTASDTLLASYGDGENEDYILPTIPTGSGKEACGNETFIEGYGYTENILIHAINENRWAAAGLNGDYMQGLTSSTTYGVRDNWLTGNVYTDSADISSANKISVGNDWKDFCGFSASNTVTHTPSDIPAGAAVIDIDGNLLNPQPGAFTITYSGELRELSDLNDLIKLTTSTGSSVDGYSLSTGDNKTFTLSFDEPLTYGTEYKLTLTDAGATPYFGIPTVTQEFTFALNDNLKVAAIDLVDGESGATVADGELGSSAKVKGAVTLKNEMSVKREYLIIAALYKNNAVEDIRFISGEIDPSKTETISTEALTVTSDTEYAKVFVWDNWTNIAPKTIAVTRNKLK